MRDLSVALSTGAAIFVGALVLAGELPAWLLIVAPIVISIGVAARLPGTGEEPLEPGEFR